MSIQSALNYALISSEANGLIVGHSSATRTIYVLPCWEVESEGDVAELAIANALSWADQNGMGDFKVSYAFRDDSNQI